MSDVHLQMILVPAETKVISTHSHFRSLCQIKEALIKKTMACSAWPFGNGGGWWWGSGWRLSGNRIPPFPSWGED